MTHDTEAKVGDITIGLIQKCPISHSNLKHLAPSPYQWACRLTYNYASILILLYLFEFKA